MNLKHILTLASIIVLTGCANKLTPQGRMVKQATKEEVKGFQFLGNINTSSPLTGVMKDTGFQNALNDAFNEAGKMGATHIVIDPSSEAWYWATSEHVKAEAYKRPSTAGGVTR